MGKKLLNLLICLSPLLSCPLLAGPSLYPQPLTPQFEAGDEKLNCREIEEKLTTLQRQTYSAKPSFYEDPYHGASIWAGTIWAPAALVYLPYSGTAEYTEYARIKAAQNRMEGLRQLKARLRCYE
jgi:hypothetical protein